MKIHGIGCCLIDYVYKDYDYSSPAFQHLVSAKPGDGGIICGGLVFTEDLATFSGSSPDALKELLVGTRTSDITNLGGPAVVAMVHAAQVLGDSATVAFHGSIGSDQGASQIKEFLDRTPLRYELKQFSSIQSPSTLVLADPRQHDGKGERSFINTIGSAGLYTKEDLPEDLYDADILVCGGTALVPHIHDELATILASAKEHGCTTVVGTVYDFRNQKRNPDGMWPLGSPESYKNIDLLITDAEEALRLTGVDTLGAAVRRFEQFGATAVLVTHGAKEILAWSAGKLFAPMELCALPVSGHIDSILEADPSKRKDTTGCGDNFAGGAVASIAMQRMASPDAQLDLLETVAWASASGGFACMYHGGTYFEHAPGEKRQLLEPVVSAYREQVSI